MCKPLPNCSIKVYYESRITYEETIVRSRTVPDSFMFTLLPRLHIRCNFGRLEARYKTGSGMCKRAKQTRR